MASPYACSQNHMAAMGNVVKLIVATRARGARRARRIFVSRPTTGLAPPAAIAIVLSPKSCKPLLLGVCVDICANYEADDVEEGHPRALGQELLGKGQRNGRHDPANLHDGHEASLDGGTNLVESAGARNDGHRNQIY